MSDQTGRTLLTLGGQIAGAAIGGPIGAAIGSYLGSQLGYALFPLDPVEGPRADLTRATNSTYGVPIPVIRGRYKVGGTIIDASEIREIRNEQDVGGKGGPEQTVATYTYRADLAVLLCEGPIVGVARIWSNGRLIFDATAGAEPATLDEELALAQRLAASSELTDRIAVYTGTTTQQPDPTFEALRGAGNVPAYRGLAYVVLADMELENAALPVLQFEVFTAGSNAFSAPRLLIDQPDVGSIGPQGVSALSVDGMLIARTDFEIATGQVFVNALRLYAGTSFTGDLLARWFSGNPGYVTQFLALSIVSHGRELIAGFWAQGSGLSTARGIDVYLPDGTPVATRANGNALTWPTSPEYTIAPPLGVVASDGLAFVASARDYTVADIAAAGNWHRARVRVWVSGGGEGYTFNLPADHYTCSIDLVDGTIYVLAARRDSATACTLRLLTFNIAGTLLSQTDLGAYGVGNTPASYPAFFSRGPATTAHLEVDAGGVAHVLLHDLRLVGASTEDRGTEVWRVAGGAASRIAQGIGFSFATSLRLRFVVGSAGVLVATLPDASNPGPWGARFIAFNELAPATVPLATVVSDVCVAAGIPLARVNTAALTGNVRGVAYGGGAPARGTLDALMAVYQFSLADIDGQLTARMRGAAPVRTLTAADLLQAESGGAPWQFSRRDDAELPARVNLTFANSAQDYDSGTQSAARSSTGSVAVEDLRTQLVLTDAEAVQRADVRLGTQWAARESVSFATAWADLDLAPGDVITLDTGARSLRLWLAEATVGAGRITWSAVGDSAAAYTSFAVPQSVAAVVPSIGLAAQSVVDALDVPLLRDEDDAFGFYLAVAPVASGVRWRGAEVYRADASGSFAALTSVTRSATVGRAETVLLPPAAPGQWTWDTGNTVDVVLRTGTLSSGTDGAPNYALIGNEVVAFVNATLLSAGRYRLSRLLRGVQGTQADVGTHAAYERFVLITANSLLALDDNDSTLGAVQRLRAVTFGRTLDTVADTEFTNTGKRIKPLPPVNITGARQSNGDCLIRWSRSARKWNAWRNLAGVPLDETPARSYDVEILRPENNTVLRTVSVTDAEQLTYTAAQIAADFGTDAACIKARVYQRNTRIGRGLPGDGVIHSVPREAIIPTLYYDATNGLAAREPAHLLGTLGTGSTGTFDRENSLFGTRSLQGGGFGSLVFDGEPTSVGTGDWYVGGWLFVPAAGPLANWMLYARDLTFGQYEMALGISGNSPPRAAVWFSQAGNDRTIVEEPANTLISNAWNHLAASRAGSTVRLFVNGALRASNAGAAAQAVNTQPTNISYHFTGAGTDMRTQEVVMIRGNAYRTSAFTPTRGRYFYR